MLPVFNHPCSRAFKRLHTPSTKGAWDHGRLGLIGYGSLALKGDALRFMEGS